ncbi:hypothetical protein ACOIPX_004742 [Salmonella enterica]|uniref:Uncharacterized protein n=1 Tax=Salmonella enterica TaxID=28901 RepID=A0A764VZP3_SALER|nr:hypothetical protein [Salmonella enterica]HAG5257534.1 hypothetical protein [Salmonella enterica]HDI1196969.1 hypothetical protein [Salmonella enterica]
MQKIYDFEKIFELLNQMEHCVNEVARLRKTLNDKSVEKVMQTERKKADNLIQALMQNSKSKAMDYLIS